MSNWYKDNYPQDPNSRAVAVVRSKKKIIGRVLIEDENSYKLVSELIYKAGDCELTYEPKLI